MKRYGFSLSCQGWIYCSVTCIVHLIRGRSFLLYLCTLFLALVLNLYIQHWAIVAQRVHDVLKNYPRLRLTHGRKVFFRANIQPEHYFYLLLNIFCYAMWTYSFNLYSTLPRFQVLEVRPVINWDKGKAVTFLLESLGQLFWIQI